MAPLKLVDSLAPSVTPHVATGVNREGKREVLGTDPGTIEDSAFWLAFLHSLAARCLGGVELVPADAHQGLEDAIATVLDVASWKRCITDLDDKIGRRPAPSPAAPQLAGVSGVPWQQLQRLGPEGGAVGHHDHLHWPHSIGMSVL